MTSIPIEKIPSRRTVPKGTFDSDSLGEGLEREDGADGLPKVAGIACDLDADEIGCEKDA